ncbi:MAG: rhodanese-like domain-containing protein [Planctomycetota bacterium]|jgi:rhodanese-related sulfurtransferase
MMGVSAKKAKKYFEDKLNFTTGPVELNQMTERNEAINIIDVRKAEDYAKGHIPGAVNLPRERWSSFAGLTKDRVNIVYCYSEVCHLAAKAAREFAGHDFPVMELEGGFEGWQSHDMPVAV